MYSASNKTRLSRSLNSIRIHIHIRIRIRIAYCLNSGGCVFYNKTYFITLEISVLGLIRSIFTQRPLLNECLNSIVYISLTISYYHQSILYHLYSVHDPTLSYMYHHLCSHSPQYGELFIIIYIYYYLYYYILFYNLYIITLLIYGSMIYPSPCLDSCQDGSLDPSINSTTLLKVYHLHYFLFSYCIIFI